MKRFQAFHDCVIGVDRDGTAVLLEGPPKLYRVMGSPYLEESCQREGFDPMHGRPGLYRATIDCRWDRGSMAGVLAGEDPRRRVDGPGGGSGGVRKSSHCSL